MSGTDPNARERASAVVKAAFLKCIEPSARERAERLAQLLNAAARLLESRQPERQATLTHELLRYLVRFDWPGVVSVFDHDTGRLVVKSKAGQPFEVDPSTGQERA